jgi:glutamine amidotransferase
VAHENTHPFHRELFGRNFVFAHNGNVSSLKALSTGHFRPMGLTDSEHAFCHLLSRLEERSNWTGSILDIQQLAAEMEEINRFGKFNCLLSDGDLLICRRDAGAVNGLLLLTTRIGTSSGVVIASEPLSNEKWGSFQPGELMAFCKGSLVYSSAGRTEL